MNMSTIYPALQIIYNEKFYKKKKKKKKKTNSRVKFSTLASCIFLLLLLLHLHEQQLLLLDVITANCSELDLKNESTSSRFTISKNWSSESFLLHVGALFGFRGAGGQSRILGILCSLDVGVRQQSSSSSLLSSSSTLIFLFCVSTTLLLLLLAPILSFKPPTWVVDDDVIRVVLTVSSLVLDLDLERSCKNSRSVDMVLVYCVRGRFCVCELNGNRGERCGVACYICRKKRSKELGRRAFEGKRERERERVVTGSLFYISC